MGIRNSVVRHKRRLNRHATPQIRRRKKVRWLLAQRTRVRNYRRFFAHSSDEPSAPEANSNNESKNDSSESS